MKTIPAKDSYDGITVPAPATEVHTAEELNDRIVEMEGSVTDTGQALDALDAGQLSKALFANGVAAQSMLDSGGVNTVVLTPITGASGLRVATPLVKTYALLDGAIFSFKANNTNTGNMTVNVGQTGGTVIGAVPLFLEDGTTEVTVGLVVSGNYYDVRYDSNLDGGGGAFVLVGLNPSLGDYPSLVDSDSNTLLKGHAYLAQTSGFVNAWKNAIQVGDVLSGYVGTTSDPAGVGVEVASHDINGTTPAGNGWNLMFFVPAGMYFELVTANPNDPNIIWTPLVAGGGNPIDQD